MKAVVAVILLVGVSQFALANSVISELLPSDVNLEVLETSVFGSIQGSYGLVGAVFFGLVVLLRLKRPGR
ncbi:hypothetical protein [Pelagicoccus sp. SDUM812005]|uniref:hypothetical protein n=1 Tax=Pelagicoccus sp. SDUM812005 TaxID=3041257 RepID=UPI00280F0FEF|nr:hypothetical protein [Pelagicoccus sp. SDUM812005]MDQ8181327.1 hypothetical protein [Pelagicoccus sp. SDUM812005]